MNTVFNRVNFPFRSLRMGGGCLKVLGVIENMSGLVCSHCSHCTYVFSQGGGKSLAGRKNLPFLGTIPVDPNLAAAIDSGQNFMRCFNTSVAVGFIEQIILKLNNGFLNDNTSFNVRKTTEQLETPIQTT